MKILDWSKVEEFCLKHADVREPFDAWKCEVMDANWGTINELRATYPTASIKKNKRIVFNIKGKKYRLQVRVNLKFGIIRIERVGTHAEYSKWPIEES
ncbi:MAG: type II toxin-antitoxin system HigB family toxin [candidate division Zixibacteria bacterium]|jgi:mRNA interferase HigB|nr:type II toxin-antitoxin system HigB family toxin [candidate division Zixibacteria bacterium]